MADDGGGGGAAEVEKIVAAVEKGTDAIAVPVTLLQETVETVETPAEPAVAGPAKPQARSLWAEILTMGVPEKIKLALRGNKAARALLINDANKVIRRLVLQNPRITDGEIAGLARNKGTDEEMIRMIGLRSDWMRFYAVRQGLVTNPRTPLPMAIKLLPTLSQRDIAALARSRNVSSTIASQARRIINTKGES